MTLTTTSLYRRGVLLGGLFLALLAAVCIVAVTQPNLRSQLVSGTGGTAALSVGVALLILGAGLVSLRATGADTTSDVDSVSRLRESPSPDADQEPATQASSATASETQQEPIEPQSTLTERPSAIKQLPLQWTDESGGRHTKLAEVLSDSDSDFSLTVDGALSKGQTVWIADDDVLRRGVVKFVEESAGPRRIDVQLLTRERRGSERTEGAGEAHVLWSDDQRGEQKTMVTIRNFSDEGFQISSSKPVRPDQSVLLKSESFHTTAKALYCMPDGEGYLVGMRFLAGADLEAPKPQWTESTELEMETRSDIENKGSDAE